MTVELAKDLQAFLSKNNRYEVFTTRDDNSWDITFANYFKNDWEDIIAWQKGHKEEVAKLSRLGEFQQTVPSVIHNSAPVNVALRLFGISKWANENNVDIVIHIHFNDVPGHSSYTQGKYSGFSIYVPQGEYYNSTTTKALAGTIFKRLQKFNPVSDMPGESGGIVEDQDLIAIGANNSVDAASMLIEYGYIYEPQFTDSDLRSKSLNDLAYQTYLGLQDFFDPNNISRAQVQSETISLPYKWDRAFSADNAKTADVYALQTAFVLDGIYPLVGKSMTDCPRTGGFGPCTRSALQIFQDKNGITKESGVVGIKTIEALNKLYGFATK